MQYNEFIEGLPLEESVSLQADRQHISIFSELLFEGLVSLEFGMVGRDGSAEVITHFDLGGIVCHDAGYTNDTQKQGEAIAQDGFTDFLPHISDFRFAHKGT